jgi:nicotinate phosphoribosyltransferase
MKIPYDSPLLADLYEMTMLQSYFIEQKNATAVFEFFVRHMPEQRHFLMAAGLEQVVTYLTGLHFNEIDLAHLRGSLQLNDAFLHSLKDFRFTGDVDALPEGSIFFADEPLLRIAAPLREAQYIESRVINLLHFQSMVASKAARCVIAASDKHLVDFGMRRAHGAEAALLSARASYIAGFDGTSTMLAGQHFGIPLFGTMAHSFVQTHTSESEAFAAFARAFPANATLLIDTYDTELAAQRVASIAQWLQAEESIRISAVRIDSGDLAEVSRRVRQILDHADCRHIGIFVSGNLDEFALHTLLSDGAPIDGFGVGTRMNTSADIPYLDCAYKLVEYNGNATRKSSTGKATWPGRKQIFRHYDDHGIMCGDIIALHDEHHQGTALLKAVMRNGKILLATPSLRQIRTYAREQISSLPVALRTFTTAPPYAVTKTDKLKELAQQVDERQRKEAAIDQEHWGNDAG